MSGEPVRRKRAWNRLHWRAVCGLVLATLCHFASAGPAATAKPNIVLVLMDNFGYGEVGAYGGGALRGAPTPRIDSLARDGLKTYQLQYRAVVHGEPLSAPDR